jgi:predicted DNA-binding transcriptional regulator AlpA
MAKGKIEALELAVTDFDKLPDSARVPLPVVCRLFGWSPATVWRRVREGRLPDPVRDGRTTRWVVGHLRRVLS